MNISDIKPNSKNVNVKGKIIEIGEPRDVETKYGDSRVVDAILEDDSARIKLSLWNDDIERVKVNSEIEIENGYVTVFRNEKQLNIGRYGKLTVSTL